MVVSMIDFSLNTETYFGFHGEANSIILDLKKLSSSTFSLYGIRNNKAFTYYMDTSDSSNDEGLDLASSVSLSTSYDLWDFYSSTSAQGFLGWVLPNGDVYVFFIEKNSNSQEAKSFHYLQNSDSSTPSAFSMAYGSSDEVYIFISSKTNSGQQYADTIKILKITGLYSTPSLIQKEISSQHTLGK